MDKIAATIITIGDELLIGQVIDTNSAWMAQELNKIGVPVIRRVAVGDQWDEIWTALDEESKKANIILITGGLGPTADDITKPLLCAYFNGKMIIDQPTLDHVTYLFETVLKRPMIERNRKQAEVPDNCQVLKNDKGTAPGMLFQKDGKIFISLPGVPHEMKGLMLQEVIPYINAHFKTLYIEHKTMLTFGIGESFLAEKIASTEALLPNHIKLAYLPNFGLVRLRLTASGTNKIEIQEEINHHFEALKKAVGHFLIADSDIPMEKIVGNLLIERNATLSTVESCTGGYIAHLITSIPGSSSFYKGTIVSYANEIKENILKVSTEILMHDGAVSEATVIQMAKQGKELLNTDYCISVSGIMGPDGGSEEKPVGTVWMAVAYRNEVKTQRIQLRYDREKNISLTAMNALNFLRMLIVDNP